MELAAGSANVGRMRSASIVFLATWLAAFGSACESIGESTLTAGEIAKNPEKYDGKKVKVSGVYTQGYSVGGKPTDPWALVIKDSTKESSSVSCQIPAKVDIKNNKAPKITAEGTVEVQKTGAKFIYLKGCTYKLEE